MAKFKLRPELITPLTNAGFIDDVTGLMKYRIPYKQNRITGLTMYELMFDPAKVIHVNNDYAASVLRLRKSPKIKSGGDWLVDDGTVPWFIELSEDDVTATHVVHEEGTEVLPRKDRRLIKKYKKASGEIIPDQIDVATMATHVAAAKTFFANQ